MDPFLNEFNEMLTTAYRNIVKVEELMLRQFSNGRLSISEIHMLESIGKHREACATVTDIAQDLDITLPSVTMMVKRLEKKGLHHQGTQREGCAPGTDRAHSGGTAR